MLAPAWCGMTSTQPLSLTEWMLLGDERRGWVLLGSLWEEVCFIIDIIPAQERVDHMSQDIHSKRINMVWRSTRWLRTNLSNRMETWLLWLRLQIPICFSVSRFVYPALPICRAWLKFQSYRVVTTTLWVSYSVSYKASSSNVTQGIVTKFTLRTYPQTQVWVRRLLILLPESTFIHYAGRLDVNRLWT